jgi:hypothetical protein
MDPAIWGEIVDIYLKCKGVYVRAEERAEDFRAPLGYLAAVRDAFDLTMQILMGDLGRVEMSDEKKHNLSIAARGHLRRAFFDICDFLSTRYRDMIQEELLAAYSSDVIAKAIPQYYAEYRQFVYSVTDDIESYRQQKGLQNAEETDYLGYMAVIDKLGFICEQISLQIPVLEYLRQQEAVAVRKKRRSDFIWGIVSGVIASAILTAVAYVCRQLL